MRLLRIGILAVVLFTVGCSGRTRSSQDGAADSSSAGAGGTGDIDGTDDMGGVDGTGGTASSTGGTDSSTGGTDSSTGGTDSGTGGMDGGTDNAAPVISGAPGHAVIGSPFSFTPTVSDSDGDPLTYSAQSLPVWLAFDPGTATFSGTPGAADEGISNVAFSVSDGSHTVTVHFDFVAAYTPLDAAFFSGDHRVAPSEDDILQALHAELDAGIAEGSLGSDEVQLKTVLEHLEDDTFPFDLVSACYRKSKDYECSDPTYKAEFSNPMARLKAIFDDYDAARYNLFDHPDGPAWQKWLVLLADRIRSTVSLPISIGYQQDFLRSLFADHIVHTYRRVNPAQPDMGKFSRSNFEHVVPTTMSVDMISRKPFRAAGVYALPGQTVTVTRMDESAVTVKVAVNSVRDMAVRQFAMPDRIGLRGYNRPKYLASVWMEIAPGETLEFTSPYGGPMQVSFGSNDSPISLDFENVGLHPFWDGPEDTDEFLAALAADEYDWAEFVTPDFEVHTKPALMSNALGRPWIGSVDELNSGIVDVFLYYHYALAGFTGDRFESISEVENFAAANGLEMSQMDYVQHVNADQAACSTACGGNPYDTDSAFDPYGVTVQMHELAHSIQPLLQFHGWGSHTNTDLYGNYAQYQSGGSVGPYSCYSRDYEGLFNIVQASRHDADPGATMHADIISNDAHGLMVFQQLMAMAQNEGTLVDGWNLLPQWQVIERQYFDSVGSDTEWGIVASSIGFGGMSRGEAASISSDDRLLIILSKVVDHDLSEWLSLWGTNLTDGAKAHVAAQGYTEAPLVYYAMTDTQACETFQATAVSIDGVSAWPL